ncbi:hypothetical protein MNBD_GAMMA12-2659 [hydrothermal vent metagenome]|uniref:Phosphate-selective porin O and P n=1 Tax=hydrothermal vent metagenome TaxID=652676 RepID=A0A3B0Y8Q2_9ZZZZ
MKSITRAVICSVALVFIFPVTSLADKQYEQLKKKIDLLEKQLKEVRKILKKQVAKVKKVDKKISAPRSKFRPANQQVITRREARQLEQKVNAISGWKKSNTKIHMAGYADVGYSDKVNSTGSFTVGTFSPIFHFQYKDLVMLEAEIEFELGANGETETSLDYMTIDWFVSDYAAVVVGKFLSPIGQFRQNLHPSWINKLPSAPPGFGHDGAAPVSDTGLQLRGGFPIGRFRTNYAIYTGNGPELTTEWNGADFELDGINAEGKGADRDGEKVLGGRFAILPFKRFEIGVSFLSGKATVTTIEDEAGTAPSLSNEQARDYKVYGFDLAWKVKSFGFRSEYVKSTVGNTLSGVSASAGGTWKTWYTQMSYRIPGTKYEIINRYTNFQTPLPAQDQKQWAIGFNYLLANNFVAKIAFESNDGQTGAVTDDDRWLIQIAYGF